MEPKARPGLAVASRLSLQAGVCIGAAAPYSLMIQPGDKDDRWVFSRSISPPSDREMRTSPFTCETDQITPAATVA